MKYRLAIFDLDGTLLYTLENLKAALNYALRESGYPERSLDEVRRFIGNGIRKLIERGVPEEASAEEIDRTHAIFKEYYSKHWLDVTKPYDGIMEVLLSLKQQGIKTAVVSNKVDVAVKQLTDAFFEDIFDMSVGERENVRRKPAPDSVYEVLQTLGFDKEEAVYIGDSDVDVKTAANAGVDCIAVEWGFRTREVLEAAGAKTFASKPENLLELIL